MHETRGRLSFCLSAGRIFARWPLQHYVTIRWGWGTTATRLPAVSPDCGYGNAVRTVKRVALGKEGVADKQCLGEGKHWFQTRSSLFTWALGMPRSMPNAHMKSELVAAWCSSLCRRLSRSIRAIGISFREPSRWAEDSVTSSHSKPLQRRIWGEA